jgi:uncharacterized protein
VNKKEDAGVIASVSVANSVGPVLDEERLVLIDAVRGFALFGVLAANMRAFNLPLMLYDASEKAFPSSHDVWVQALLDIFISAKAYTLFAFLFGLGFAIQMTRSQARSPSFPWFYLRRLGALALFGLIHGFLIWDGDILLPYSITGFVLFWFRKAVPRTVLTWSACLWTLSFLLVIGRWIVRQPHMDSFSWLAGAGAPPDLTKVRQIVDIYAHANLGELVRENGQMWHRWIPFVPVSVVLSLPIFLMGLYVWRKGWVQTLPERKPVLRRICAWTLSLGLITQTACVAANHLFTPDQSQSILILIVRLANLVSAPMVSCGYATGLALLFQHPRWRERVLWLAPVGRMALTNYLTQSVFFVLFYSGVVTGLYGRVGPAWNMFAAVMFYLAQLLLSHWWFRHFRFGPVEWFWRGLTYLKWPRMRMI